MLYKYEQFTEKERQMFQNQMKRFSASFTGKEMHTDPRNYFLLIRMAQIQKFNKMLSCPTCEKTDILTLCRWEF